MRTQVAIIGGGPSGLLLGQLLHRAGIDTILLERRTRAHVLSRIRAGVLEQGLVGLLEEAGVAARLHREGLVHDGVMIAAEDSIFRIDITGLTGTPVVVYGQTEITRDLYEARTTSGGETLFEVEDVVIHGADSAHPEVHFTHHGQSKRIACDYIAGCDGFHGVSRRMIPGGVRKTYEKTYPFGWLGILAHTPPVHHELIYATSEAGFALCSQRNEQLSRYYIQCALSDSPEDWTDAAFWDALRARLPASVAEKLVTGPSIEKSIAPLRSFVCEPMRWGRLFLVGDAAHIVPPTGAKGLNTAASDVHYLYHALREQYEEHSSAGIDAYSQRALARVWKTERFSWWFSSLLHRYPDQSPFDIRMQRAEIAHLRDSPAAQMAMAQSYVGVPY